MHQGPDLLAAATPTEILTLASRTLVDMGADMATSQLCDDSSALVLVGHDGFDGPFCEFFALAHDHTSACGCALRQRRPVMVADVATDPIYAGTESGQVTLRSGSRACLALPLLDPTGRVLGVIAAHWRTPGARDVTALAPVAAVTAERMARARHRVALQPPARTATEVEHLRVALSTRTVIGQAQGILMVREGVSDSEAFDILRRASQRSNRKLRDLAADVVARAAPRAQRVAAERTVAGS